MSTPLHEGMGKESLSPEEFLQEFEATHECFRLASGIIGGRGETEVVDVSSYHAPIHDFLDAGTHISHLEAGHYAPTITLPLEIGDSFKYAFDDGDPSIRVGRGAYLHIMERQVPVRLVTISMYDRVSRDESSFHWIYRDGYDHEQQ